MTKQCCAKLRGNYASCYFIHRSAILKLFAGWRVFEPFYYPILSSSLNFLPVNTEFLVLVIKRRSEYHPWWQSSKAASKIKNLTGVNDASQFNQI